MSHFGMSNDFYNEWNARQKEYEYRMPLWARNERLFNCEAENNRSKGRKLFGFLKIN